MGMSHSLLIPTAGGLPRTGRLLHLRADQGITQNGAALFTASDKASLVMGTRITRASGVSFSVELWVKPTAVSGYQGLFEGMGYANSIRGVGVYLNGNKVTLFLSNDVATANYTSTGTVTAGVWSHVVVTVDRTTGTATFYINGSASGTADVSAYNSANLGADAAESPMLGSTGGAYDFLGGAIAGVRYYDGNALTAADVTTLYQNKEPISYANLPADIKAKLGTQGVDWPLTDEPGSASYLDLHGSNDLTFSAAELLSNTGFETRTGRTWASFATNDKANLIYAGSAADIGTRDMTIAINFHYVSAGTVQHLAMANAQGDANDFWWLYIDASHRINFQFNDATAPYLSLAVTTSPLVTGTTYTVVVKVDRDGNATCKINNGTAIVLGDVSAKSTSMTPGSLSVGGYGSTGLYVYNGKISQFGVWDFLTSTDQDTELYNSGLGKYWGELSAGLKTVSDAGTPGCLVYYDLTEASGTRASKAKTADLTEYLSNELVTNGTFTEADGTSPPTGWTNHATYPWDTCDVQSNKMRLLCNGDGSPAGGMSVYQQVNLTSGRTYNLGLDYTQSAGATQITYGSTATPTSDALGYNQALNSNTTLSTSFTATGTNGYLKFWRSNDLTAMTVTFDNVTIKAASIPCVSDADVIASWGENPSDGAIAVDTTTYHGGAIAVRITRALATPYVNTAFNLTLGSTYIGKAWMKASSGTPSSYIGQAGSAGETATSTTWTEYSTTFTVTGSNSFLFGPRTDGATIYYDDASLKATKLQAANGPSGAYASDSSGNGYHGTLTGFSDNQLQTAWVPRGTGLALTLDGAANYVNCGLWGTKTQTTFTVACHFRCTGTNGRLVSTRNGGGRVWEMFVESATGKLSFSDNNVTTYASTAVVNDNVWRHGTIVVNGANSAIYVNGVNVLTFNPSVTTGTYGVLCFGTINLSEAFLNGQLDDVRIYDVALTPTQVAELYTLTESQEVTGATAIAQWKFNDGPPSQTATDGEPVAAWESIEGNRHLFRQTNILKRPKWVSSILGGKPVVRFEGLDDYLSTLTAILTGEAGTVVAFLQLKAEPNASQVVLAQADTGAALNYLFMDARLNDTNDNISYAQKSGAPAVDALRGNTQIFDDTAYCLIWNTGGAAGIIRMYVNGVLQTITAATGDNNGNWWADISGADVTSIGALVYDTTPTIANLAALDLAELVVYDRVLSDSELARCLAYGVGRYGVSP